MFSDPQKNVAQFGIGHGMHIADLGAGSGFYTIEAAKMAGPSGRVYAVEVQKGILEKIKNSARLARLNNVEVIWGNIETIGGTKLKDASVDRVIASNVLFQVEHKDNFCLEIKRILKPGGRALLIDWSDVTSLGPKTLVPQIVATALFEKVGLHYETSINAGDHHYGLIFKKK